MKKFFKITTKRNQSFNVDYENFIEKTKVNNTTIRGVMESLYSSGVDFGDGEKQILVKAIDDVKKKAMIVSIKISEISTIIWE